MNAANIDNVLADFLISYTNYVTFIHHWGSIKRQFSLRGLVLDEQNYPKIMTCQEERRKVLRKPAKKRKQIKERGWPYIQRKFITTKSEDEESSTEDFKLNPSQSRVETQPRVEHRPRREPRPRRSSYSRNTMRK